MNLENSIKDVITKKLEDGTVEKLIAEEFEKGIKSQLESLFRSYGSVGKIIEKQIESVIVPYLDKYDYSGYITKLDAVLTEVLKATTLDNKKILENFKHLTTQKEIKEIKVSDIFSKWIDFVAEEVSTDDLEVEFDDEPYYESVEVTLEVEYLEGRDWSSLKKATIFMECEHDKEMNAEIHLEKWDFQKGWRVLNKSVQDINSLRYLDKFAIFLATLAQQDTDIIIDIESDDDCVTPEEEPEASFS